MEKSQAVETMRRTTYTNLPWALIGGALTTLVSLGGLFVIGRINESSTAIELIEVMSPPMQMLGFATITATITMISLILTLLGVIKQGEIGFDKEFYEQIGRIILIDTILLVISALLLTLLALPLTEAETELAKNVATIVYYLLILVNAIILGLLVMVVLMLYDVTRLVIDSEKIESQAASKG